MTVSVIIVISELLLCYVLFSPIFLCKLVRNLMYSVCYVRYNEIKKLIELLKSFLFFSLLGQFNAVLLNFRVIFMIISKEFVSNFNYN